MDLCEFYRRLSSRGFRAHCLEGGAGWVQGLGLRVSAGVLFSELHSLLRYVLAREL